MLEIREAFGVVKVTTVPAILCDDGLNMLCVVHVRDVHGKDCVGVIVGLEWFWVDDEEVEDVVATFHLHASVVLDGFVVTVIVVVEGTLRQ